MWHRVDVYNQLLIFFQLLNKSKSALTAVTVLKKMCDHPRLITNRQHDLKVGAARLVLLQAIEDYD